MTKDVKISITIEIENGQKMRAEVSVSNSPFTREFETLTEKLPSLISTFSGI